MSFSQGLSGLNAASKALDVVGNNIANSQTVGFKAGSVSFADIFAGTTGLGVQVAGINQDFNSGSLASTGRDLDIAIDGKGFFRFVNEGGSVFYGRNGQFNTDEKGNVINSSGMYLTGYQATGTPPKIEPGAPIGPIRIPTDDMQPEASTAGTLTGNLKADDDKVITSAFDAEDPSTYNFVSQIEATDSLGSKHTVKVYFVQTSPGEWKAYAGDETSPRMDTGSPPKPIYSEMQLKFDASGNLIPGTTVPAGGVMNITGAALNGANALNLQLDLKALTKNASDSLVKLGEIDGQAPGKYQNFKIGDNGEVVATYSNGKRQTVAQIVLADFPNTSGLQSEGNNVWSESSSSGQPFLGASGTGSFGDVNGSMLEQSNVDMGAEMVNMIVYQRNYQSNSQTIKTQSELLQTLVNLR
ncbi:flagellar hook protein FlgE [Pantoea sp. NPDC088449]|uniref:flagellar hook protein FlgE n=1 Tax=Pantoea sp. NPDC088449 TaxID=3364392 RepID=UPI00381B0800